MAGRYDSEGKVPKFEWGKGLASEPAKKRKTDPLEEMLRLAGAVAPAAGTAIGAGLGSMAGGIGAIPGAAIGGGIGSALGGAAGYGADALGRDDRAEEDERMAREEERRARTEAAMGFLRGMG